MEPLLKHLAEGCDQAAPAAKRHSYFLPVGKAGDARLSIGEFV